MRSERQYREGFDPHDPEMIQARESHKWKMFLPKDKVDVPPPPSSLTKERIKGLDNAGFLVFYIPPAIDAPSDIVSAARNSTNPITPDEAHERYLENICDTSQPLNSTHRSLANIFKGYVTYSIDQPLSRWVAVDTTEPNGQLNLPFTRFLFPPNGHQFEKVPGSDEANALREQTLKTMNDIGFDDVTVCALSAPALLGLQARGALDSRGYCEWTSSRYPTESLGAWAYRVVRPNHTLETRPGFWHRNDIRIRPAVVFHDVQTDI